jgi:hypothetical protein
MPLERNEVVPEHQIRGNCSEQLGVDPLFAKIDKRATVSLGKLARVIAFVLFLGRRCEIRCRGQILIRGGHGSLLYRAA